MEANWNMWVFIMMVAQLFLTVGGFCLLKFNDFKHVEKATNKIMEGQESHTKQLTDISDRVSYLEGREGVTRRVRRKKSNKDNKTTK